MSVEIRTLQPVKSQLRQFVKFGIEHYRGNDSFVPPLIFDEIETLQPEANPAFDYCRACCFMAYRDGRAVGRIAAIVNDKVNERTGRREARFGFVDFIDDGEVSQALFDAAEDWARSQGMTEIIGPMGFTDMDHEGMLVEGFDRMGTMATIYNHPWYPAHLERLGYVKDVDWVEYRVKVPESVPEKYQRIADMVSRRYGLRSIKFTSRKKLSRQYGHALFELINRAYDDLYGYSPLSRRQIDYYIDKYLSVVRLDCISIIVDAEDRLVAFGISIPSLSKALRRGGGKLLPTGWWHLLRGIYGRNDVVDLMLIAVAPHLKGRGVNAMIFADLIPVFNRHGYRWAESNLELEGNDNVRLQWQYFEYEQHRRRRAYRRQL